MSRVDGLRGRTVQRDRDSVATYPDVVRPDLAHSAGTRSDRGVLVRRVVVCSMFVVGAWLLTAVGSSVAHADDAPGQVADPVGSAGSMDSRGAPDFPSGAPDPVSALLTRSDATTSGGTVSPGAVEDLDRVAGPAVGLVTRAVADVADALRPRWTALLPAHRPVSGATRTVRVSPAHGSVASSGVGGGVVAPDVPARPTAHTEPARPRRVGSPHTLDASTPTHHGHQPPLPSSRSGQQAPGYGGGQGHPGGAAGLPVTVRPRVTPVGPRGGFPAVPVGVGRVVDEPTISPD